MTLRLHASGREVTYDPRQAFGVEIFNTGKRSFAEGERLQLTRPWKTGQRTKIANRELAPLNGSMRAGTRA